MSPAGTRVLNDLNLVNNINEFDYIKKIIDVKMETLEQKQQQGNGVGTNQQIQNSQTTPPNSAVSVPNNNAAGNHATIDTGRYSVAKKVRASVKDADDEDKESSNFKKTLDKTEHLDNEKELKDYFLRHPRTSRGEHDD